MAFSAKTIFITGGGSGIGRGLAQAFHQRGIKVVIGGRRADLLAEVCTANPGMDHHVLDVASAPDVARAARELTAKYPQLDCVINNAGMQRQHSFAGDKAVPLDFADAELDINVKGLMMMCAAFLPHLRRQPSASLINVGSGLAFVPFAVMPVYCATKAAVRSFSLALREQLKSTKVRVIEISPPAVQTELHDYMGAHGRSVGIPLADFVRETMTSLDEGLDDFAVGDAKAMHGTVGETFPKMFAALNSRRG